MKSPALISKLKDFASKIVNGDVSYVDNSQTPFNKRLRQNEKNYKPTKKAPERDLSKDRTISNGIGVGP